MPVENTTPAQVDTKADEQSKANQSPTLLGEETKAPLDPNQKPDQAGQKPPVDGEKPKEGEQKEGEKKEEVGAPEAYESFKVPEGVEIEKAVNEEFTSLAKEMNLSQEKAQKLIDLAAKNASEGAKKFASQQQEQWAKARETWIAEIKSDKEIGGSNFQGSLELARRAVNKFGDNQVREVFNSGWGDNPALFRMFVKIGKAMSEDKFVEGSKSIKDLSAAEVLYGKKQ